MDKKELRKQVKVLKSQYSLEQKVEMSRPLWKELEQTDFFKEARTVLLYWSMDDEVSRMITSVSGRGRRPSCCLA